ncbi:MAG: metal ABC transporter permease [Candidatus Magasanikbacteria bacterium]|jgi:zinc transport system permease protein|nr:metal ABC transporter permease [Candidatus Magasanikbacteria bacterium]MBT4071320.1 metal ABC transporter permease [Candidatus Magasanikbacteria bacterium]
MLDLFQYTFMQRAIIAGICSGISLGWLGVFLTTRKMSFLGDGLAHASLAGVAIAILLGWAPIPLAILFAVFIAIIIYIVEKKTTVSADMAIGMLFTASMAVGIILLQYYEGYQPELMSYLFGNILTITQTDLITIIFSTVIIIFLLLIHHRKLVFTTFDPDGAYLSGIDTWKYDILLYIISAVTIVLSIKLVGLILVSALIITPSAIGKLFAKSFTSFLVISTVFAINIVFWGIILSYILDWPSGATIILFGFTLFLLGSIIKKTIK